MLINPGSISVKQESSMDCQVMQLSANAVGNAVSAETVVKVKKPKANKQAKAQQLGVTVAEATKSLGKTSQAKSNVFKLNEGKIYFLYYLLLPLIRVCLIVFKLSEGLLNIKFMFEVMFCFGTPFLKMILNESQTIWLFLNIY